MPSASPSETTSIVARTGAPTAASVTPRCASTSVWPAAVAPPCEPMAGTTKGSRPAAVSRATMSRTSTDDVGDAAATDGHGDAGAGSERRERRLGARPLVVECREHVDRRQDVEVLPHFEHGRQF